MKKAVVWCADDEPLEASVERTHSHWSRPTSYQSGKKERINDEVSEREGGEERGCDAEGIHTRRRERGTVGSCTGSIQYSFGFGTSCRSTTSELSPSQATSTPPICCREAVVIVGRGGGGGRGEGGEVGMHRRQTRPNFEWFEISQPKEVALSTNIVMAEIESVSLVVREVSVCVCVCFFISRSGWYQCTSLSHMLHVDKIKAAVTFLSLFFLRISIIALSFLFPLPLRLYAPSSHTRHWGLCVSCHSPQFEQRLPCGWLGPWQATLDGSAKDLNKGIKKCIQVAFQSTFFDTHFS